MESNPRGAALAQLYAQGRWSEAEAGCRAVLVAHPRDAEALHLLSVLAHRAGFAADAVELMRQAIASDPRNAACHSNLGVFLAALGRFDAAATACRDALALDPGLVDAHYNLGNALMGARDFAAAAAAFRRTVALRCDFVQAHNNLGNVLKALGDHEAAIAAYRQALVFQPDYAHARSNLASALQDTGRLDEAMAELRRAVAGAPDSAEIRSNLILGLHYDPHADAASLFAEARRWDERFGEAHAARRPPHAIDRSADRPLRIGYVSPDLRLHSVAFFLLPLLEGRERDAAHVTCYATGGVEDDVTARLRSASDAWCSLVGLSDDAAAERIRDDRIDLLFDLSGHTANHRLALFARRPAPIQITYLGFPGTTGLRAIDYRLTDALVDPSGREHLGSERLVRLPASGVCFAPPCATPDVADAPLLRGGRVTFGNLGNLAKVGAATLTLWSELLRRVPTAHLLLKSVAFRDRATRRRFERRFAGEGIDASRLRLLPDDPSIFDHLRSHERIDIVLDSFPFNGLTTTCQALWMGVPVVTLAGQRPASRMGLGVLSNLGLDDLVATTADDYLRIAADLAGDPQRVVALRSTLRPRLQASPVGDARRFARDLQAACRGLWREWCERHPA